MNDSILGGLSLKAIDCWLLAIRLGYLALVAGMVYNWYVLAEAGKTLAPHIVIAAGFLVFFDYALQLEKYYRDKYKDWDIRGVKIFRQMSEDLKKEQDEQHRH